MTGLIHFMSHYLYILRSFKDGSYYVGSTNNLEARVAHHNRGRSQYTKSKRPWELVYVEEHPDRSTAMKTEYAVKGRKSRDYITKLIERFSFG